MEIIAKAAALTRHRRDILYEIVGDGPELPNLKKMIYDMELKNVIITQPIPLSQMPQKLENAYAALVTLKDLSLFKGTRPAKMLPPLAAGLPIVYSGAGRVLI